MAPRGNLRGLLVLTSIFGGKTVKVNVSDYIELATAVYIDAAAKCTADVSDLRDLDTLRSRVENEGISFLTISLPQFARDFERALTIGQIDSTLFIGWRRIILSTGKRGSIPAFLQGMISRIFDRETGRINEHEVHTPNNWDARSDYPTIVDSVRQICLTFKKVEIDCTPERVSAALQSFISTERSFEMFTPSEKQTNDFASVSSMLWGNLVSTFVLSDCIPKHGPGATAERISGNQKYRWRRWHDRLEPYFPLVDSGYPLGIPEDSKELQEVTIVPENEEQPVRVVPVPKTLKSPRIIAIEPCCNQFIQQGILGILVKGLESYWLSRYHINFGSQDINQRLAIRGSRTGRLATIDLSDASDRVPRELALKMFDSNPDFRDAIDACRSTRAQLPTGEIISPLRKFASMGSALCFPVEAMYFYTICVEALLKVQNLPLSPSNLYRVTRMIHIYGDDIIVPSMYAVTVIDHLQKYNCKVNTNKTFFSGYFRESCGVDAYQGRPVQPVYLRRLFPDNRRQASQIISMVETANLFYLKGYWRTTTFLRNRIEGLVGILPYKSETAEGLGHISFLGYRSIEIWNENLQRFEVTTLVPSPVRRTDVLDGYAAIQASLTKLRNPHVFEGSRERNPLEISALHGAVALKRRRVPPL
jgi:hypothetical protein